MTAIEEARAVLPENHDGWDCDGSASICDRRVDALRALIAEYDRLSVPPSDDEREALDQIIRDADGWWPDAREAILATFRRQGPITDAQRHADDLLWYVDYCLGLPMYQNAISEFGQGAVETLRMVKRTLAEGLHPDAQAAAERARSAVPSTTEQESDR